MVRWRSAAWPTAIGASQPNVSQHLAVLRSAGLVEAERDGREVRYRLADPDVMVACGLMRARSRATADADSARSRPARGRPRRPAISDFAVGAAQPSPHLEVTAMDEPLNLVLFSGTDDKLQAAAVLTAGAAALGKPVNIFLQYWALEAFRADRIGAITGWRRRPERPAGPR